MGRTRIGSVALALGVAVLAAVAAPASAARHAARGAPVKFGADLTTNTQPSNSSPAHTCQHEDSSLTTAACTWMMLNSEVGSPNNKLKAPANGTITQIWVIAGHAGSFTPYVGFLTHADFQGGDGRVTAHGKVIHHGSSVTSGQTYKILKFTGLNISVKKGEVLGIKAKSTSILRCDSGSTRQLLFQPPLAVGASTVHTDATSDCSLLIEAVMNPA
jgi:hypothetical protein